MTTKSTTSSPAIFSFRAQFEQHQSVAVDALLRLLQQPLSTLLTLLVLAIALALPSFLVLLIVNLQAVLAMLQEQTSSPLLNAEGLAISRLFLLFAERFVWLLSVLLALGVLGVIGNTVRLSIENRRAEILVMKLVGATDGWVSRPFLYTGFWYGLGAGIIALALVGLSLLILAPPLLELLRSLSLVMTLQGLSFNSALLLVLCSAGLGLLAAGLTVLRNLRNIEPL
jgi:cell division transport system permease protein